MNTYINLINTTGIARIDQIICQIICLVEQYFPHRIRGYYLVDCLRLDSMW